MKNTAATTRRIAATVIGPLLAAGAILGGVVAGTTAVAGAQPADVQGCSSMAMPTVRATAAPNAMTRAGQVSAASARNVAESMPPQCPAGS